MRTQELKARLAPVAAALGLLSLVVTASPAAAQGTLNPAAAAIATAARSDVAKPPAAESVAVAPSTVAAPAGAAAPAKAQAAGAGTESVQTGRVTEASELAALQAQHALWKVRAEIAKFKAEVRRGDDASGAQAGMPAMASPVSLQSPMPMQRPIERAPAFSPDTPRVLSLRAFDGDYDAVLDIGGRAVPVLAGDTIDGGWKVVSIGNDGVKLANGKRVRTLRP